LIPKIIHHCWFGGDKHPALYKKCRKTWEKHCPDYKFMYWDEKNSPMDHPFIKASYEAKKYAFVSDYIRLWVLIKFGGIYMDIDMLLLHPLDDLLNNACFLGEQVKGSINASIIGVIPNHNFLSECLKEYDKIIFNHENLDDIAIPVILTNIYNNYTNKEEIKIFSPNYFYPYPLKARTDGILNYWQFVKNESYTVHLWNASWIPEIESIRNQTYQNWECIIVNDGSKDNTIEIANFYCNVDDRIKLLNIENGGLSNARNIGIKHSHGAYILPLDADDKILPSYMEKAISILIHKKEIAIVLSDAKYFGEMSGNVPLNDFSSERLHFDNSFFPSSMFRRQDYNQTNGYDTRLYSFEDWDFWLSLIENGGQIYKIPEVLFCYRVRKNSMLRTLNIADREYLFELIVAKHPKIYNRYYKRLIPILYERFLYKKELDQYKNSSSYRIGNFLLSPIHYFKKVK